jgi:hypothetical protein
MRVSRGYETDMRINRKYIRSASRLTIAGSFVATTITAVGFPTAAYAYLDPGTGSMILQGVIAAVAAGGIAMTSFWHRITGWFRRDNGTSQGADSGEDMGEESHK